MFITTVQISVPGVPEIQVTSVTTSSVTISWSVPSGSAVDSYEVVRERDHNSFSSFRESLNNLTTTYTVTGLEEYGNTVITITVRAHNMAGSSTSAQLNVSADLGSGTTAVCSSTPSDDDRAIVVGVVLGLLLLVETVLVMVVIGVVCYRHIKYNVKPKPNSKITNFIN